MRVALLQGTQQIFVIADLQIGMQAALQQHAGAAQLQHLVDFFVDRFEREDVAVLRSQRAVKRAERTILGAKIGVIDVAVDLIGDHARIVFGQAHLVRGHANAQQVIGFQHLQRFLFRQAHGFPLVLLRILILSILTDRRSQIRHGQAKTSLSLFLPRNWFVWVVGIGPFACLLLQVSGPV